MNYQIDSEFMRLRGIVAAAKPRRILEVGSLVGETLAHWIELASEQVISVDLLVPENDYRYPAQKMGHDHLWADWARKRWIGFACIEADSTLDSTVQAVWQLCSGANGLVDFLFIDGGHDARTCALDYLNYSLLVRPGGLVAFHDAGGREWPDVKEIWNAVKRGRRHEYIGNPMGPEMGIGVLFL